MATFEQVKAEAARRYPHKPGGHTGRTPQGELRAVYVQTKTISVHRAHHAAFDAGVTAEQAMAVLRAAGFYIEEQ